MSRLFLEQIDCLWIFLFKLLKEHIKKFNVVFWRFFASVVAMQQLRYCEAPFEAEINSTDSWSSQFFQAD